MIKIYCWAIALLFLGTCAVASIISMADGSMKHYACSDSTPSYQAKYCDKSYR